MNPLTLEYIAALAQQLAFISALLGGFAAAFFATLLVSQSPKRVAGWAAGLAAVSATCFIGATMVAAFLSVAAHPDAPARIAASAQNVSIRAVMGLLMILGIYTLFGALGTAGWVRSRALGIVTA
ncbi:MAG: hypothetical protein AAGI08_11530, partial [Bacteroidota bacterium]